MVADAVVRVFIDHGDRTDRTKARLKYVLDKTRRREIPRPDGGKARPQARPRRARRAGAAAGVFDRTAHIGIHPQKQEGLNWIGVVVPVGRLTVAQMKGSCRDRARSRRRRYPAHGLAEPADLRRADRKARRGEGADRSARPCHRNQRDPRRPRRLHRQYRLQVRRLRHQAPRRGDRALVRDARVRSTRRSISISPAAIIPARSISSAKSACSPARCRRTRMPTRSRAITS